ncbi:probable disease resistance protein At5g66900 [Prunus avium]|uniref:Probable disease resistance protein At5g66900 n=1 Tax=Prunus avium TaxID=42229 RepID=A0A6P5S1K1_PRUAV|nr:probable disease resistance protein At5g66900 [Prunus avium]
MFETHLRDLKCTLELFQQVDEDVRQHPNILFCPMQGLETFEIQMEKGVQLVEKCSKVCPWNVFDKPMYTRKLIALDASLRTLLSVLTAHITSDLRARVINVATVVNHINVNIAAQNQNVNQIRGWSAIPEPPPFTVGLDAHVEELKLELLKDEASMLVVTGLGGCGKTTLAQKVCEDQKVKEKFRSNIFFVIVSKKTNCLVVQELCQKAGSLVPALQDEAIAFNWLQEFLKKTGQDPLLLVLDDVWLGSESLLDKFGEFKRPNYNILVTSRFQFTRFGPEYPLRTLEQGDAMTLFRHAASRPDRSSDIPEDLAKQIVQLCKGFPLAITTIGRSVCEQPTEIWEKRVAELSKGSSILDSEDNFLACLKSSLDALDGRMPIIKECFIDLASFPEDRCIPAVALIDMWAELYGLDKDSWSIANIRELTNRNLVNLVTRNGKMEMDGYYSEHFVTQHDMLRNLAIHQTGQDEIGQEKRLIIEIYGDSGDNLPNGWTEQKNKPKKTRLLSISTDGLSSAKWHDMNLPKAEVLVLNFQTENYVLPKFELPEEIGEMNGLRKINMGQCSRLQELPVSILNLGELREVICDEETENLWGEPFKSSLKNINITVAKEQHNLNWLYYKA